MIQGGYMHIEVAYALPGEQVVLRVRVPQGAQVLEAIRVSGVLVSYPEIDVATASVGVFGRLVRLDMALRDRDRVEIYRPLVADAKQVRRQRAKERKAARRERGARP
jgi:putative ubiquitin-RnfH superfamily antitoxin RatB of RatAB toxin-antitoxin module